MNEKKGVRCWVIGVSLLTALWAGWFYWNGKGNMITNKITLFSVRTTTAAAPNTQHLPPTTWSVP